MIESWKAVASAAVLLTLGAAACGDRHLAQADAAGAMPGNVAPRPVASPDARQPSIAPGDTATRLVRDALSPPPDSATVDSILRADSGAHYQLGESPLFARRMGWPVHSPVPLPGALLPRHRIVAYYGNPLSHGMGVLGEYPTAEMLRKLQDEVDRWNRADPDHPVVPALQLIASVAQAVPGSTGKYRSIMYDSTIARVHQWARQSHGVFFLDIQTGQSSIQEMLPKFARFLADSDVHLAIDPEFMLVYSGAVPGTRIGRMKVSDINWVTEHVAQIVREQHLPPKVVVIHRFRSDMIVGDTKDIVLHPEVQLVMNMDGWGSAQRKRDSYQDYIVRHPVEYTGFKLFYHNDTRHGWTLMTPAEVLRLRPQPLYIQYQ